MLLETLNKITLKKYIFIYEYLLGILAAIMVFIKPGTIGIWIFVVFNLLFYRKLNLNYFKLQHVAIIAIPFLLNLLFIWNNESIYQGIKYSEKYISMLLFPLLILGQCFEASINKVLKIYAFVFTIILFVAFILHVALNIEAYRTYMIGKMVWQMGYKFALSLGSHAPALNMHVAFLVLVNYYLLMTSIFKVKKVKNIGVSMLFFLLSISMLFIINTRLAVFNTFLGIIIISFSQIYQKMSKKRIVVLFAGIVILLTLFTYTFIKMFPYVVEKYTNVTFKHMDKIGKLDDFKNPEAEAYSALVTRLSIWKTAWETSRKNLYFGVGTVKSKNSLTQAYIDSGQKFLAKYKFQTHNQYLDFLLKFGILGLLGVIVYIFYIFWLSYKIQSSLALFFFVLFFTSNLTDDFLIRYDGITFSAFWITLFSSIYIHKHVSKAREETENFFQN